MPGVNIVIRQAKTRSITGGPLQVALSRAVARQEIAPSGVSQPSSVAIPSNFDTETYVWRITNDTETSVRVAFGLTPVAASPDEVIPPFQWKEFGASEAGEKVAVINT